jgi:hypothetical protein
MIEHVWTVICRKVVTDQQTEESSLIELIDTLEIAGTPPDGLGYLPRDCTLASYWVRGTQRPDWGNRGQLGVRLVTPDDRVITASLDHDTGAREVDVTAVEHCRTTSRFETLPITIAGRYEFQLSLKLDEEAAPKVVASVPFWLRFTPVPQGGVDT